jgi:NIPSNAP
MPIVEQRTYTLYSGKVSEYLRLYEQEGLAIQQPILGHLIGYFSTDIGTLNQIIHLWKYDDMEDRTRRRAALSADPEWKAFVPKIQALILQQESKILIPAPFSPVR